MILPGPKIAISLQSSTEGRTATGGGTDAWVTLLTFQGFLEPLSGSEGVRFGKETAISTHRIIVGYSAIGDSYAAAVKPKNRIYVAHLESALDAETFDIVSVMPYRSRGTTIGTFEIILRKVE